MQFFVVLGGIMFFAQCALRYEPQLRVIMGKPRSEQTPAGTTR